MLAAAPSAAKASFDACSAAMSTQRCPCDELRLLLAWQAALDVAVEQSVTATAQLLLIAVVGSRPAQLLWSRTQLSSCIAPTVAECTAGVGDYAPCAAGLLPPTPQTPAAALPCPASVAPATHSRICALATFALPVGSRKLRQ